MEDQDKTSINQNEENLERRKYFSKYIIDIEFEIQKYGFHVSQSEILGFILEKIAGTKPQSNTISSFQNHTKREMNVKADEISHYIINRKFPFIEKFHGGDEKLNKFQRAIKNSRLANLKEQTSIRMFEISNFINSIFVIIGVFLGFQSILVLAYIFTSSEGIDRTFLELDGSLIVGYNLFWNPSTILVMAIIFPITIIFSYLVLNLPTLSRIKPNLNDHYYKLILKIKLNFIMGISFISFMILGSVSTVFNKRINGLEPIGDLGFPILISLISGTIGFYIGLLLRKECWTGVNYNNPKLVTRLIIYFTNFIAIILSLMVFIYLALIINSDFDEIDGLSPRSNSIPLNLTILNLVSFVSLLFFFLIIIISSLINQSQLKNKWHKFILIQILFQSLLVLLYSVLEYYFIITYNDFTASVGSTLRIAVSSLTQGMARYYGSLVIYFIFIRVFK